MPYPESMQIEITRITLHFTPPGTGPNPARKPRTPIPLIDRVFQNVNDIFEQNDHFMEDDVHGTLLTQ